MIDGSFQHEDFCGHKGTINAGDLQVEFYCTVMRQLCIDEYNYFDGLTNLQLFPNYKQQIPWFFLQPYTKSS